MMCVSDQIGERLSDRYDDGEVSNTAHTAHHRRIVPFDSICHSLPSLFLTLFLSGVSLFSACCQGLDCDRRSSVRAEVLGISVE